VSSGRLPMSVVCQVGAHRPQGLCVSGWRGEEQGDRLCRVLAVVTQAGGDLADAGPVQQADGSLAQQGHDGRSLPLMDGALIFPQGHIRDAV